MLFASVLACSDDIGEQDASSGAETETAEGDGGGDTRLFDETGVWALERYAIDGGLFMDIAQNRKNSFLLRFRPEDGVVAAAACHEQGTDVDVNASSCTNAALSSWTCQCFSYTFEDNQMVWQEFAPGDAPPPVGDGAGGHELVVATVLADAATMAEFSSLPDGLFNSDGELSKHIVQRKAEAIWTLVDINQDAVPDLQECSNLCFTYPELD